MVRFLRSLFGLVFVLWAGAAQAGFLLKGVCYETRLQAREAYCAGFEISRVLDTGGMYVVTCSAAPTDSAATMQVARTSPTSGTPNITTQYLAWPTDVPCDHTAYLGLSSTKVNDYMSLWGMFLLAAVVILGAKALYSRFRIDHH